MTMRFLCLVCLLAGTLLPAQTPPEIDRSTIRVEPGPVLTFRFTGLGQAPGAYAVETVPALAANATWTVATGVVMVAVAEGLYRATVPLPESHLFCRVRALDPLPPGPPLVINEVMSDNVSALADGDGQFWDWVEIYNPNDDAVDLEGFALSDDEAMPGKWRFPAVQIQPHAVRLVFASDLNRTNASEPLHLNFKLKAAGETLVLSDAGLRPLDRLQVPALAPDQSTGRMPDGGPDFVVYTRTEATPGSANLVIPAGPVVPPPTFSPDGGFSGGPVSVQLAAADSSHVIRYTLDGSAPTPQSPAYASPLDLSKTTVVRAVAITPQGTRSAVESRTFLIGVNHGLPILSLATAPTNMAFRDGYLYGMGPSVLSSQNQVLQNYPYSGSYAWQNREVEVAAEFFETNRVVGFRQRAGMKIFGGWGSRGYPQKSLALFARRSYGAGTFDHRLFPDIGVDKFESFILRNSGNDNQGTHQTPPRPPITEFGPTLSYGSYFVNGTFTLLRDAMMQRLLRDTDLDTQAYRPAVVYLNGDYWGIYSLREKMSEDYVLAHHDRAPGSVDLIEGYGTVNAGNSTVYSQMRNFLSAQSMANTSNYAYVAENYLDIDNTIDYHLAVIYFQNFDIGNIKCWRPRAARGRFRWMVYDQDYGFGLWPAAVYEAAMARDYADYRNMFRFYTAGTGTSTAWPNAGGRTLLLRSLLANPGFKEQFIRRCADLLNGPFREATVEQTIQEMAAVIRPEIAAHLQRWSWSELTRRGFGVPHKAEYQPFNQATWETNLTVVSAFGRSRPARLRQDALQHFQLAGGLGTVHVQVEPAGAGRVQLNSLTLDQFPWSGIYFVDIANTLRPIPNPGYRFAGWQTGSGLSNSFTLSFRVPRDTTNVIQAVFAPAPPDPGGDSDLVITEFQYHPPTDRDTGDWVEIHHRGNSPLNLAGWILRDDEDTHAFLLPDVTLAPGATLVLVQDDSRFRLFHPATVPVAVNFRFGLNNSGDTLRLFRPDGTLAVSIPYDDLAPWPAAADGGGATLQLISLQSDPSLPSSWRASPEIGGTAGRL